MGTAEGTLDPSLLSPWKQEMNLSYERYPPLQLKVKKNTHVARDKEFKLSRIYKQTLLLL